MQHRDFLVEEYDSVETALNETLRHDYGPSRSSDYFQECRTRLAEIKESIDENESMDGATVATLLRSLSALGSRICLIERSRLGEFSWPFAEAIREISVRLFVRTNLDGKDYPPIVHVIAEGMHYQIVNDVQPPVGKHRIMIVAFPRQLKHHVLLHALFGHELGHTAASTPRNVRNDPGRIIATRVMGALSQGPLRDETQATAWLASKDAPSSIAAQIKTVQNFKFREEWLRNWRTEIFCDLFGLLLFGPCFAAAHRMILEPLSADPASFDLNKSTHPPFSVRRHAIVRAIKLLGWDKPVCASSHQLIREAETTFLTYATDIDADAGTWPDIFTDGQIGSAFAALNEIFSPHVHVAFSRPDPLQLAELVDRLTLCRPPIVQRLGEQGAPVVEDVKTFHCLYAGWTFWSGHEKLHAAKAREVPRLRKLKFLEVNKLCQQALLQQCAIRLSKEGTI